MVVDDDENIRRLNADVLRLRGYQIAMAEDGEVAWELLRLEKFDLVITDHNMPNLSGVELVEKMRAGGFFIPVILCSGSPLQNAGILLRHKPLALLPKPFSHALLFGLVEELLSNSIQHAGEAPQSGGLVKAPGELT